MKPCDKAETTKTQTKPKILRPDFSHRLPEYAQEATPRNLSDIVAAILIMTPSYPISGFGGRTIEFFGL